MRPNLLPSFFLLLFIYTASAQEYSYARYDVKDGLAGSVVYDGVEDKEGFLWFATETGVSRFDGTLFKNFSTADGLPDNEILKLFVDSKGRVWMMPFRNSICYYWKGKIYNQENDSLLKKLSIKGFISSALEDRQGNLMLTDSWSLHLINNKEQIKEIRYYNGDSMKITGSSIDNHGNFQAMSVFQEVEVNILTITPEKGITGKEVLIKSMLPRSTTPLFSQISFLSPRLWIYRQGDSLVFLSKPDQVKKCVAVPKKLHSISAISDSIYTLNTGDGAIFYNARTTKEVRRVLKGIVVNRAFRDSEGNYWFMTAGTGIFRIGSFEFTNFEFSDNDKNQRPVFSLHKVDSLLYVGSENALLFTIDLKQQTVQSQPIINQSVNTRIMAITSFSPKEIYLGTDLGVINLNRPDLISKAPLSVKSMQCYKDSLLVAVEHGLFVVSNALIAVSKGEYRNAMRLRVRATCGYIYDKVLYCGTVNGLYSQDSTGKIVWLGTQHPLLREKITDIEGAPDGTLWIATSGKGIIGYKAGKVIYSIRQKDGLTSDICRNVFVAGHDVWVGTDRGLNRIQWQTGQYKVTTYTSEDGLIANIINAIYVDGPQVYVGTPAGLTSFDVDKISLNSYCKLRVTGIQAAGMVLSSDTTRFNLPPANNAIRFDFAGISYRSAGDVTYRYRLIGLDDKWQTTRETFLNYPTLPSGDYELQIIATNKFGVESDMIRIPFVVEKHLWEKTWFRILTILAIVVLVWLFVNNRIKRIRRQNDEKVQINNRMTELEQMALKAQMNPHFIFNSLNSVQQYVIDKDLRGANKFITEFSRLIRLTLDISSKTKISIYEEISYLTTYLELEKTKFEDKFSYSVTVDPAMDTSEWFILPMILQPYVENSIRHGVRYRMDKLGHIKLSFRLNGQYLICQVEDNGVGRKKAGEYKSEMPIEYQSKGMTLTAKRIEMLNKNQEAPVLIDIEDLEINHTPAGTRVTLQFPVQEAGSSL